jgi:hypothetical protein
VDEAARDEDGVTSCHLSDFVADSHSPRAAQNVVNLFRLRVMMPPDGRACGQDFFGEAATLDVRRGAVYERANLRAVRCVDDGCLIAIDNYHAEMPPDNLDSLLAELIFAPVAEESYAVLSFHASLNMPA